MAKPPASDTQPKRSGRMARVANVFLPVTEVTSAAKSARSMGASVGAAVGAVATRLRAIGKREESPQATVVAPELLEEGEANAGALRGARFRWVLGVISILAGVYQVGGAFFTHAGVLATINFLLSAVLLGTFGLWLSMVAARDAAVLQGARTTTNLDVLKSPGLWFPW